MRRAAALVLLAAGFAFAAPVPKCGPKLEDVFGEITDKKSECKFEMDKNGALTVTVPKEANLFVLEHQTLPAVRSGKKVDGDFEVTVRVSHSPPKGAGNAKANTTSVVTVSAGVVVVGEGGRKESVVLVHHHRQKPSGWVSGVSHFTNYPEGSNAKIAGDAKLAAEPTGLRLTRRGDAVTSHTSADGKDWTQVVRHPASPLGSKLMVGVVAFQSTDTDYTATFDEYVIKPLKDEKK